MGVWVTPLICVPFSASFSSKTSTELGTGSMDPLSLFHDWYNSNTFLVKKIYQNKRMIFPFNCRCSIRIGNICAHHSRRYDEANNQLQQWEDAWSIQFNSLKRKCTQLRWCNHFNGWMVLTGIDSCMYLKIITINVSITADINHGSSRIFFC